jgi:hypothetical protein
MKRLAITMLMLLTAIVTMQAAKISEQTARARAKAFMQARGHKMNATGIKSVKRKQARQSAETEAYFHIFNIGENSGFIVMSGDDRMVEVLAYSDSGSVDADNMPEALQSLLEGYAEQGAWIEEHPSAAEAAEQAAHQQQRRAPRTAITPMIRTRWNQGTPYNLYCPVTADTRTVTGCVATSMAQVMYYYRYPASSLALDGFTTRNGKFTLDALDATTFDWANMQLTYTNSEDTENAANRAIATLMQYCGWALQMNYNIAAAGGSSAYNVNIATALKTYFGYDNTAEYIQRKFFSYTDWIELIYNELAAGRPVVLGGQSIGGGHSFVCDGYQADDFFHINWGWGGSSDGYFRLSALNPYDQGIGGSSTLDGFSYSQEAIIGIKPDTNVPHTPQQCLSLEGFQFTDADDSYTRIFYRENKTDDFTSVPIYLILCDYLFGGSSYDVALQFLNDDGNVAEQISLQENLSTTFNSNVNFNSTITIPASLANGTYRMRIVSRTHGESYWQPCMSAEYLQMRAVVDNLQLTLTSLTTVSTSASPTCTAIQTEATITKGIETEITASLTGSTLDYHDMLFLYVDGKPVMGKHVDIAAGKEANVHFAFIPKTVGTNTLDIRNNKRVSLLTKNVNVTASDATDELTLTMTPAISNLDGSNLYGNAVWATVNIVNPSTTNSYAGYVGCYLRIYSDEVNYTSQLYRKLVVIDKENSIDMPITFEGLEVGGTYQLRFVYQQTQLVDEKKVTKYAEGHITEKLTMTEGYTTWLADGTTIVQPLTTSIDAGSARCMDLRAIINPSTLNITRSTNPNCLYLFAEGATLPDGFSETNVVKGTTAEEIVLSDGNEFYAPIDFTATEISYTRTFTLAANGSYGWSTILLPFDVETVKVGEKTVDWFHHSADTGKNFWLRAFTGDGTGRVYFDYASTFSANTPYLIAVPDDRWGEEWQMTGKSVTFSGSSAAVKASSVSTLSGNNYKFCGATTSQTLTDVYALNEDDGTKPGGKFVKGDATSAPFRGWIAGSDISSLMPATLTISSGAPTSMMTPQKNTSGAQGVMYDLSGKRIPGSRYEMRGTRFVIKSSIR